MNHGGNTFNFVQDPLLQTSFRDNVDYGEQLQQRIDYLTQMKNQYQQVPNTQQKQSLWDTIDVEVNKLTEEKRVQIIAKMLAGSENADSIRLAKEMLCKK